MRRSLAASAVFVLALSMLPAAPVSAAGATDWHYNATTRHTYGLTGAMPWVDAEALAVRYGGHLATINDQAEQDWLLAQFPEPFQWIGMNDRAREGTWVWSSGTRVRFTAWQDTQPDDWKGFDPLGEDAAVLSFPEDQPAGWVSISGRWFGKGIIEVPGKPKSLGADTPVEGAHDGQANVEAIADECEADGWAWDQDSPLRGVAVRILAMRTDMTQVPIEIWRGPAENFRQDLYDYDMGDGTYGFSVDLRPLISYGIPYEVTVQGRDVQTGEWLTLDGSPRQLVCWPL
jgi:hypothetical protein